MAKVTTHALDLMNGKPAEGLALQFRRDGVVLCEVSTNADGRCDEPLGTDLPAGDYEIVFGVGEYFLKMGVESPFLTKVPVLFRVEAGAKYHVPLTFTPWAYSTYRGS